MATFLKEVDARTKLAGANKMELLLFSLGNEEVYGINVFKVREVMKMPELTQVPDVDTRIRGMANLRGRMVPVVNLRQALHLAADLREESSGAQKLIVAEYNMSLQGLGVCSVDRIMRISWDQIKPPPALLRHKNGSGPITAVTLLEDGRTVQILDVEQILTDIAPGKDAETDAGIVDGRLSNKHVLFADDSSVARTQIRKTLERLGVTYRQCTTGREAWEELQEIAGQAEQDRVPLRDRLHLVLSDIEMPEMDGFTLTRMIRSDARFDGIHVILHSSLTGTCNTEKGRSVGASDFVTKFDPRLLKEKLQRYC